MTFGVPCRFVLQVLLHTADLSNPCKEWRIHVQWTHAILAEFFSQVPSPLSPKQGFPGWPQGHLKNSFGD